MGTHNQDNRLKCKVAGFKGWREVKFFAGKNPDGTAKTRDGFRNVLTDESCHGFEPPGPTGDLLCARYSLKENAFWDSMAAELAKTENPPLWVKMRPDFEVLKRNLPGKSFECLGCHKHSPNEAWHKAGFMWQCPLCLTWSQGWFYEHTGEYEFPGDIKLTW